MHVRECDCLGCMPGIPAKAVPVRVELESTPIGESFATGRRIRTELMRQHAARGVDRGGQDPVLLKRGQNARAYMKRKLARVAV